MSTNLQWPLVNHDQRKYARLDIALSVSYAVQGENGECSELAEAISSDVSAGGLRLMTPGPIKSGSMIDLEINIHGREADTIHANGEVVWQNKLSATSYETGAVIKYMEEQDKQKFLSFVFDQMARIVGNLEKDQVTH